MSEFVTIRAAARLLEVSESSIRRYFDEGKLEGHRTPSGTRRIRRESVDNMQATMGLRSRGGINLQL